MLPSFAVEVLDGSALAARAAALIATILAQTIRERGSAVFVPSAGRTPTAAYRILSAAYRDMLDWHRVQIVQMDEYCGIGAQDPRSFAYYLLHELVAPLRPGRFIHFNGDAGKLIHSLDVYERQHERIDLVVHGIGRNGHVGFNEPGSSPDSGCRRVALAQSTLHANFSGEAERQRFRHGVTLGMATLRGARNSLILATGHEKADAVRRMCYATPSTRCPASLLRGYGKVAVLLDHAAALIEERNAHFV